MTARTLTEGELWARGALARLRRDGYAPGAVVRFVADSHTRAREVRRARPGLVRQARTWLALGALVRELGARLAPAGAVADSRRAGHAWWALCGLMLEWHLGMVQTPGGLPVSLAGTDALTLARAWLVPVVGAGGGPVAVALGAATDLADGALARRTRTTRLGRDLEWLVDACFGWAALGGASRRGGLSPRVVRWERLRVAAGIAGIGALWVTRGRAPVRGRRAGRRSAPLRTLGLLAAGTGRRRLADRMLSAGGALAVGELAWELAGNR